MEVDHHNVVATSLVEGVVSHVSSKHGTPQISPRPEEVEVNKANEEDESVDLDGEAEKLLDEAMVKQGYDVVNKERSKKERPLKAATEDEDDGLSDLLSKQQREMEGETSIGISPVVTVRDEMSPTKMEVMNMMYEQIDDHIGSWEAKEEDKEDGGDGTDDIIATDDAATRGLEEGKVYSGDLEFDDEDSVEELPPELSVSEEGRRHEPSSPVLVSGGQSTAEDMKIKEMEKWNAVREEEERRRREVEEINVMLTEKEQARKEEAQKAKTEAKERQMKLRADARARRANEIAKRKQLENVRIGVDTRVPGAVPEGLDFSVQGSELSLGVAKQQQQSPNGGRSPGAGSPILSRADLSPPEMSKKKKSPLAQQLAMQLEQIQTEQDMERLADASDQQASAALTGSGAIGRGREKEGRFEPLAHKLRDSGSYKHFYGGADMDSPPRSSGSGSGSPSSPFALSEGRGKAPRSAIVEPEEGFYLDSKGRLRETDTGKVKGKGPGGSSPSIPTRDNKPRLGGAVREEWDQHGGTHKKKTRAKYPYSEARLERRRAEVEQQRQALQRESVREDWEPSTDNVTIEEEAKEDEEGAADGDGDGTRVAEQEREEPYDDNVTNRYLSVSDVPFQPAAPRTPEGEPASKPGGRGRAARLPSQRKKAEAEAARMANHGAGAGAGKERHRNELLSPDRDKAPFSDDPGLNAVISDIVASRSPSPLKQQKKAASPASTRATDPGPGQDYHPDVVEPVPVTYQLKHTSPKLPALPRARDLYDASGHLIAHNNTGPGVGSGIIHNPGPGKGDRVVKVRSKKPLYVRMEETAARRQAEEERKRQEDFIEYRLRRAEAQPTREEIEEHKRLHDEGILRQRLLKATDNRRKLVGGVNYENDDLVSAQNQDGAVGYSDTSLSLTEQHDHETERSAAFQQVFRARDDNRRKPKRDWKYLDQLGGSSSSSGQHAGPGAHGKGGKGAEYNNKYHQMAVKEARLRNQGKALAEAEHRRNQQRKKHLSENVRETFLPSATSPLPLEGRRGRVGFDYDQNYSYESPSKPKRNPNAGNYQPSHTGKLTFDQERVERLYASRDDFHSPSKHGHGHGATDYDRSMDLALTLSPRSTQFGQEYINEVLERDDTEKALAKIYKGGFDQFFRKPKGGTSSSSSSSSASASAGAGAGEVGDSEVYRPNLSLIKNKKRRGKRA